MGEWTPHIVPGQMSLRWTRGNYEIRPVVLEKFPYGGRYEIYWRGTRLTGGPWCLMRAQRHCEAHATGQHAEALRGPLDAPEDKV